MVFSRLTALQTRLLLAIIAGVVLTTNIVAYGGFLLKQETPTGTTASMLGGDYVVFYLAGAADVRADPASVYDPDRFLKTLQDTVQSKEPVVLPWLYPPTMLFITEAPAQLDFAAAFFLWEGAFLCLFLLVLWRIWPNPWALFIVAASPAVFRAIITGQNGLLTGALFAAAIYWSATRPRAAGAAAALLTVKPQFGVLIPIAYAAGRHWRAFLFATLLTLAFLAASLVVYGADSWSAMLAGHMKNPANFGVEGSPLPLMMSIFNAARLIGAPFPVAIALQTAMTIGIAFCVVRVMRRTDDRDLRLALLATAAPLATPYALHYDSAVLLPGLYVLAKIGVTRGFLRYEAIALGVMFFAPEISPMPAETKIPMPFLIALVALLLAMRRVVTEITSASAGSTARPDS